MKKLLITFLFCLSVSLFAGIATAQSNNLLIGRCGATRTYSSVLVARNGDILIDTCPTGSVLVNGAPIGGGGSIGGGGTVNFIPYFTPDGVTLADTGFQFIASSLGSLPAGTNAFGRAISGTEIQSYLGQRESYVNTLVDTSGTKANFIRLFTEDNAGANDNLFSLSADGASVHSNSGTMLWNRGVATSGVAELTNTNGTDKQVRLGDFDGEGGSTYLDIEDAIDTITMQVPVTGAQKGVNIGDVAGGIGDYIQIRPAGGGLNGVEIFTGGNSTTAFANSFARWSVEDFRIGGINGSTSNNTAFQLDDVNSSFIFTGDHPNISMETDANNEFFKASINASLQKNVSIGDFQNELNPTYIIVSSAGVGSIQFSGPNINGGGLLFKSPLVMDQPAGSKCAGTSTLVAGTVTVTTDCVKTSGLTNVQVTYRGALSNAGILSVTSIVTNVSFTVTSDNASDASQIDWLVTNL